MRHWMKWKGQVPKLSESTTVVVVSLIIAAILGGIIFACYENAKSNREVKQQKFNACLHAGGSPIVNGGSNVMCIYGKTGG